MLFRHALKSLKRTPVYAITVILTLALGLASVGAMFAVVHGVLLAPLPYGAPDRLVSIQFDLADGNRISLSPAIHATYRRFATQIEDIALHRTGSVNVWMESDDVGAEHLTATWVTASMMPLLRAPPLLGRTFSEDEERRGGPDAVILSEAEWRMRFGAAPEVIGRSLIVNNVPREVVGVMPAQFSFPAASTRMWLPAKHADDATAGDFFYAGVARLAPAATADGARQELGAILPRMGELFPRLRSGGSTAAWLDDVKPAPRVQPLRETLTGSVAPTLWMLAAVSGLVLLVAWENVANLMLIRADASRHDVAVREALGASPLRASAHVFGESVLLGLAAAVLALLATLGALMALRVFGPVDVPRIEELAIGPRVAGFIVLVAILGTLVGTAILTRFDRPGGLSSRLHDGTRGQTAGRPRQRMRATVTVLQIAAALVVLAGSALLLSTAYKLHDVHPGFEAEQVTTFRILLPFARYQDAARVAFHARLTEQVGQLPSVLATGLTAHLPLGPGRSPEQAFQIEGEDRSRPLPVNVIGNGYFGAMRIPVLAGRDFRPLEWQRAGEIIISQRAAMTLFADPVGAESLGKTLTLDPGGPTYTVVGVVGDVRYEDLAVPPAAMVYRPQVVANVPAVEPGPLPAMVLTVRSNAPADALVAAVRGIVREIDPSIPVFEVSSMREVVRHSMARLTLTLTVMTAAAAVALLLGMIGLYGVMAYLVALRSREFGLRMALGADPNRIVGWVLARGLALTAIGVTAGLIVYALAVPYLRASLSGIATWDPLPLVGATVLLVCTAALACWLPALRAAAVDPAQALRAE
ncbi:MAG TPA: ADOP family duplicated permease [Xanthomonadaceae bacterium]|nr:ADOP family duplicated permease [Xanthomonadaceae bacterium]